MACFLAAKAPWLDAIEPKWVHGKRAIVEPGRPLASWIGSVVATTASGLSHSHGNLLETAPGLGYRRQAANLG